MLDDLPAFVDVVIEYPRWAMLKRRRDGRVDFVAPLPCPYNYGSIPGYISEDGDALDVVVLGRRLPLGSELRLPVVGIIDFVDDGCSDPKVICARAPMGALQRAGLRAFFTTYGIFKRGLARLRGSRRPTRCRGWLRRTGHGQARGDERA